MFNLEELQEIKIAVNELIANRISYKHTEKNIHRLKTNDKYLEDDYKLLQKIINNIEEIKNET